MLSKEQKMQYGEYLRQQIKQREGSKKNNKREQPAVSEDVYYPPPNQQPPIAPPSIPKSPQINTDKFKNERQLQKEMLAKKMQSIDYNPFGKIGGGAPNKHLYNIDSKMSSNNSQNNKENQSRKRNYSYDNTKNLDEGNGPNERNYGPASNNMPEMYQMPVNQAYLQGQYKRIPTPQFLHGAYNNAPFISPQYAPPAPYGYVAQQNNINYIGKIQLPPQPQLPYQPSFQPPKINNQRQQQYQNQLIVQNYNRPQPNQVANQQIPDNQINYQSRPSHQHENVNIANMSEAEKEIYKNGGRNLLKLQNQTPEQIIAKQNQKLKLQQELKRQMEQVARKKKEEEQRIREQDERLQKKNKQFLQREKEKLEQQLKGKKDKAKNVQQVNANIGKGNQNAANFKKQKYQKIREEVARRQQEQRRLASKPQQNKRNFQEKKPITKQPSNSKMPNDLDQVVSVISSDTQMSKGFNTAISKQFFRKEREKGKYQKVTQEIQKMRKQINNQGVHYHQQIQKLQRQAETAKLQKQRADQQIERLKRQLRSKMDMNNKKYLEDIYRGKVQVKDPYYADQVKLQQTSKISPLKPRASEKLVVKQYNPEPYEELENNSPQQFVNNNSDMMSLIGDSKKIPLDIDSNESMSISKLGNFAKDTDYFNSKNRNNSPMRYRPPAESIQQQDEQRGEQSRQSKRGGQKPKEQIDKLLQSRKKSRGGWGQLSSVNDDIVDEIEKMLQNKPRPKSHLSSMGEQTLGPYDKDKNQRQINQFNLQNRKKSESQAQGDGDGTINSLDRLLSKYM